MSVSAKFEQIVKRYGDITVIDKLDLTIEEGSFFTLLGPSGCGKTTLLRMVAGFNTIEGGQIYIADSPIQNTPAYKRNMGMVFQNYAIFPHMSVYDNVAYGLKARKVPKQEINTRVIDVLETMQIVHLKDRSPKDLSGGQQQRVALARAIVIQPRMLLMDEPLSNLDAKLRIDMRNAIKEVQRKVGITTIYVTHDQEEALAVSDKIAIMNKGVIYQIDTPVRLYQRPNNVFVGTFIGHMNILPAEYHDKTITIGDYTFSHTLAQAEKDEAVKVGVRPEEFIIHPPSKKGISATVQSTTFLGRYVQYVMTTKDNTRLEVTQEMKESSELLQDLTEVSLVPIAERINIFNADGTKNISE